jgi:hypothetical protein
MTTETFVHEFKSPINCYKALAVRHGHLVRPVAVYEGRQCYVTGSVRVRGSKAGHGFHNKLSVHFLDDCSIQMIPAGRFSKAAKNAPLPVEQ